MSSCCPLDRPASEKEIELISGHMGELGANNFELVHPSRKKIFADLHERGAQELKDILDCEVLAERESEILLHCLSDDGDRVVVYRLQVSGDEMGLVSADVVKDDWDFQSLMEVRLHE